MSDRKGLTKVKQRKVLRLEILIEVKNTYPQLPVLMLSAMADDKTVKKTLELGVAGVVAKPFGPEDLIEHLKYA